MRVVPSPASAAALLAMLAAVSACGGTDTAGPPASGAGPSGPAGVTTPAAPPTAAGQPGVGASRLLDPPRFAAAAAEPDRVLINVHVPFEGALAGTDAEIPFDQIADGVPGLPTDRNTPLAIYCRSGRMSAVAAERLATLGYRDVVELRGGMIAWTRQGLPLTDARSPVR